MAFFDSETERRIQQALEEFARSSASTATDTRTAASTEIVPGERSPYAAEIERLGGRVGAIGARTSDRINPFMSYYGEGLTGAPKFDRAGYRGRTEQFASELDELAAPMLARAKASGARGASTDAITALDRTAANPIDDDVEAYYGDRYRKGVKDELARVGLIGQGRGADLLFDAENRYAMERKNAADARRINAATTAGALRRGDLDLTLQELGAGTSLRAGAKGARDATEQLLYDYELQERMRPAEDARRIAEIGALEAGAYGLPSNLYGTLYGLDQARLNQGRRVNQAQSSTADVTGTTSSSGSRTGTGSGSSTSSPSAFDALSSTLKLIPTVAQTASAGIGAGKDLFNFFSTPGSNGGGAGDPYFFAY